MTKHTSLLYTLAIVTIEAIMVAKLCIPLALVGVSVVLEKVVSFSVWLCVLVQLSDWLQLVGWAELDE